MKTLTLKTLKALMISDLRVASCVPDNDKLFSGLDKAKKQRPKNYQGIIRCRAGAGGQGRPSGDGKPAGPDRPLGKGDGGI